MTPEQIEAAAVSLEASLMKLCGLMVKVHESSPTTAESMARMRRVFQMPDETHQ